MYNSKIDFKKHDIFTPILCTCILTKVNNKASLAEWVRSLTSNHLSLTAVGSNPYRDFGFFHMRNLSSFKLRESGGSTQVPVDLPEIMHGRAPEVFLHQ
jgi:hypothetical protein